MAMEKKSESLLLFINTTHYTRISVKVFFIEPFIIEDRFSLVESLKVVESKRRGRRMISKKSITQLAIFCLFEVLEWKFVDFTLWFEMTELF